MPGEFSTVGANYALDIVTGRSAGPGVRTTYLVLLTSAPGDTTTLATMTEVSTAGYARQPVTWVAPSGDPSTTSNSTVLTFGPFTADPPNVTHCAVVSALTGTTGDFLMWWQLDAAKDAALNESIQLAIGSLAMALD